MISLRTSIYTVLGAALLVGVAGFTSGCEKKGPAEKAGEKVDNATQDAGHQINKAADKAGDAVDDATH
jgi:hyperosmotically inducible protein